MAEPLTPPPPVAPTDLGSMIPPMSTAVLVVDIQRDFAAPDGAMARAGLDLSGIEPAIDRIESLIAAAHAAGVLVAFARVVTREQTDSLAMTTLWARKGRPGGQAICRAGQPGAAFYRIAPDAGDLQIEKTLFSSFVGTSLDHDLRQRGIDTLVVCGLTTDCCVDSTVRDAFHRDYHCFVVSDACAAYDHRLHAAILTGLAKNCALLTTTEHVTNAWLNG